MHILLEYKDKGQSGECGRIAVWMFEDSKEAVNKMGELAENGLPLALYEVKKAGPLFH